MFWLWLSIFLVAIVLEIITPSALVTIWFAVGAIFSLVLNQLNIDPTIQIVVFFVVSIVCCLIIRPIAARYLRGNVVPTNADRLIGRQLTLQKEITPESWGEVRINGLSWSAAAIDSHPIKKGELVEVKAIEGSKLIVSKV